MRRKGIERILSWSYVYPFRCQVCGERFRSLRWGVHYARRSADRREYQRIAVNCPARIYLKEVEGAGQVTDLSLGGCKLYSDLPIGQDDLLTLDLDVPALDSRIRIEAALVRQVASSFAGVQFLAFADGDKERLGEFVGSRLTRRE